MSDHLGPPTKDGRHGTSQPRAKVGNLDRAERHLQHEALCKCLHPTKDSRATAGRNDASSEEQHRPLRETSEDWKRRCLGRRQPGQRMDRDIAELPFPVHLRRGRNHRTYEDLVRPGVTDWRVSLAPEASSSCYLHTKHIGRGLIASGNRKLLRPVSWDIVVMQRHERTALGINILAMFDTYWLDTVDSESKVIEVSFSSLEHIQSASSKG
ncbi:hypothetical protein SODALDRAFT_360444 [Sodiomyces alkalinus F11]|uniref:Uncharacterized protein n=1 Tax=Sodiomyces alkalinus (strain CBS 110278 / VKM F-3762 / F11) TaxID=1314773 RepID=A0A3N2PUC0_SODAK|nr:hypothetical protein SODALDRAFT_360444 [Sodiomyces alkalinus F11]ROT38109.1 hypothetical protein SODALDRAFT_360444 [Sodiomyces alkalinus F11]